MPLKSVFIDAGNTLLYEMPSRAAIYAEAAAGVGLRVTEEEMSARMRRAHRELPRVANGGFRYSDAWFVAYIERVFQRELGVARAALRPLAETLFERFSDPATFRLFPGAIELLDGLRERGLGVGIVSNWSARLPRLLAGLGIAERVDFVLCSALERCEKPEPEIFRRALQRARVAPGDALHAGDHPQKDIAGARSAGIESVLVDHSGGEVRSGVHRVGDHGVGDYRVQSLQELLRYVEERAA